MLGQLINRSGSPPARLSGERGTLRNFQCRLRVDGANQHAIAVYSPKPYFGPLILFLASEPFVDISPDPRLAWKAYVPHGLEMQVISGPHQSLLTEPNAVVVAEKLQGVFAQAGE
jgi:thioesterase domain-containing protein